MRVEREPDRILKELSGLLGAVFWMVSVFILHVLVPLVGLTICCESLSPIYYSFAYWLPLAWARDRASEKRGLSRVGALAVRHAIYGRLY
jgi:hypothetical protein